MRSYALDTPASTQLVARNVRNINTSLSGLAAMVIDTELHSIGDRGGSEKLAGCVLTYVEEKRRSTPASGYPEGIRLKTTWYGALTCMRDYTITNAVRE